MIQGDAAEQMLKWQPKQTWDNGPVRHPTGDPGTPDGRPPQHNHMPEASSNTSHPGQCQLQNGPSDPWEMVKM